ncbi:hypothetical protein [Estrella lausannensis]|uniref:CopG family transcriptional regulator n=1 Tax=Estrella lausannensis TaxID=483423 RepID=A0A0H5DS97_9BACT|nr:hypothetical protein [Estrella lausannensis]CRX39586.1 hypothetical protein ELAC_p0009 [Estrella lausannensis]
MKNTVRINFDFSRDYYPYLKMLCAKRGQSLKDLASELLIREIEEHEDLQLAKKATKRLRDTKESDLIDFGDAAKLAGWTDDE